MTTEERLTALEEWKVCIMKTLISLGVCNGKGEHSTGRDDEIAQEEAKHDH